VNFTDWPGKNTHGTVPARAGDELPLLASVDTPTAKLVWFRIDNGTQHEVQSGTDYTLSDDTKTLTIKRVQDADAGEWKIRATADPDHPDPTDPEQTFSIAVESTAVDSKDDGPEEPEPDPPGEWDPRWAVGTGIFALILVCLLTAAVVIAALTIGGAGSRWHGERIPAVVCIVLLIAGSVALTASIAVAALDVRTRARARSRIAAAAGRRGLDPTPVIKAGTEFVKAFGGLRASAAFAVCALALFGGAFALAWAKFPDQHASASVAKAKKPIVTTVLVKNRKICAVAVRAGGKRTRTIKVGRSVLVLDDRSRRCGVMIAGGGLQLTSGAGRTGTTRTVIKVSKGDRYAVTVLSLRQKKHVVRRSAGAVVAPK
jgi:hypothetical protein